MSNGSTVLKNSPSLTNIARLVPSLFNPDGILLNVVFFVYGQKRRERLLRPLEADVVRHNRCRSHR